MRYITKKDEELIKTINLMINMPIDVEKNFKQLKDYYDKNPNDPDAAFSFGFYNFLVTSKIVDSNISAEKIELIIDAYNHALKVEPGFWLVKMFKSILLLALPEIMQDENELVKTLEDMINSQNTAKEKKPYFIVPYIIYADYKFSRNDPKKALALIEEAEKNAIQESVNFRYLNDYFRKPLKDFSNRLMRSGEDLAETKVKTLNHICFPIQ